MLPSFSCRHGIVIGTDHGGDLKLQRGLSHSLVMNCSIRFTPVERPPLCVSISHFCDRRDIEKGHLHFSEPLLDLTTQKEMALGVELKYT